jgi:hypothetical protein
MLVGLLLMSAAPAISGECLTYNNQVTLRGVLSKHTFAEEPNYESIAHGDHPATYFFISPDHAVCVAAGDLADNEPAESGVARIQLVFNDKTRTKQLRLAEAVSEQAFPVPRLLLSCNLRASSLPRSFVGSQMPRVALIARELCTDNRST